MADQSTYLTGPSADTNPCGVSDWETMGTEPKLPEGRTLPPVLPEYFMRTCAPSPRCCSPASPHQAQAFSPTVARHLGKNIWHQDAHFHPLLLLLIQALPVVPQPPFPDRVPPTSWPLLNPSASGSMPAQLPPPTCLPTNLQDSVSRPCHEKSPVP